MISHLVESTVLPLELVFEHRNYLALLGPILIFSYYVVSYQKTIMLAPVVVLLAFLTFTRIQSWSDSELFLTLELLEHPNSVRSHIEWANFLLEHQKIQEAHQHLSVAHQLAPQDAGIRLHQLLIQCETPGSCRTIGPDEVAYQQVLKDVSQLTITPYSLLVFNNLVEKSFNHTCPALPSQQILKLLEVAIHNPRVYPQKQYLSTLYHLKAGVEVIHHNMPGALEDLEKAYQLYPKRLEPLVEKVHLQIMLNQYKIAECSLARVMNLAKTQWVKDRAVLTQLKTDIDNHLKQSLV